jgi:hypothetical protein
MLPKLLSRSFEEQQATKTDKDLKITLGLAEWKTKRLWKFTCQKPDVRQTVAREYFAAGHRLSLCR